MEEEINLHIKVKCYDVSNSTCYSLILEMKTKRERITILIHIMNSRSNETEQHSLPICIYLDRWSIFLTFGILLLFIKTKISPH